MIEISHLTKQYGRIKAVNDISFSVDDGEIVGFLGPNGAGKTTTMNILSGYVPSTEGVVKVGGYDVMDEPEKVKRQIGYLPEQPPLYMDMTVAEYLGFASELKKVPAGRRKAQVGEVMELMMIGDHCGRLIKNLSKGYRQRVGFAQALIGSPPLLILDEPTVGLDPKQIIEIRKLITALGKKHTIILSSHILQEVSAVCERVIIINKGRIAAVDTPENLAKGMGSASRLSIAVEGEQGAVASAMSEVAGVRQIGKLNEKETGVVSYMVESDKDVDVRRPIFFAMANLGCPIVEMRSLDMSLEEIFLELVASEKSGDETTEDGNALTGGESDYGGGEGSGADDGSGGISSDGSDDGAGGISSDGSDDGAGGISSDGSGGIAGGAEGGLGCGAETGGSGGIYGSGAGSAGDESGYGSGAGSAGDESGYGSGAGDSYGGGGTGEGA
jgi:ABC-2 type transport system ATP-binding protein